MIYGREEIDKLNISKCLEENYLSKEMIRILECLTLALMRKYYLGTLLNVKDISVKTSEQRRLRIALM